MLSVSFQIYILSYKSRCPKNSVMRCLLTYYLLFLYIVISSQSCYHHPQTAALRWMPLADVIGISNAKLPLAHFFSCCFCCKCMHICIFILKSLVTSRKKYHIINHIILKFLQCIYNFK